MHLMNRSARPERLFYILAILAALGLLCRGRMCVAEDGAPAATAPTATPGEIEKVEQLIRAAGELRQKLQQDPHRPRYHFLPPWGWMNDPNGAIFWKGRYHLFYQYRRDAAYPVDWHMEWGHASSADLIHWTHHPIALTPTQGGPDGTCCASGVAVNNNGVPTLVYHGVPGGTCIATSQDEDLVRWAKHPANPVIPMPKPDQKVEYGIYDPCAWKHGDHWYALTGWGRNFARPNAPEGDVAFLFRSPDLVRWEYVHPFYQSERRWTDADEDCAVPDFFPLGNKHVLLLMSHKRGAQYYIGRYENERFFPEQHARMNWTGGQLIAPNTLLDDRGRRVFFGWINEARSEAKHRAAGWAGMMTLPRRLSLADDNTMRIEPVPEVQSLRRNHRGRQALMLNAGADLPLDDIQGDCLEIQLEMTPIDARQVGLAVRCSPDQSEKTNIFYDTEVKTITIDGSKASLITEEAPYVPILPDAERPIRTQVAPFELAAGESLKLQIFLDRSVLEVYINGRQCLTQRIYPSRPDSLGVRLFSRGGQTKVTRLDAWDMAGTGN
jgi:beta-fructofuranosidase